MPSKQQLDKEAWNWAHSIDVNDVTLEHVRCAYRVNLPPCKQGSCKRNCKGNPFCLNSIGEKVWLGEIDERKWHDIEDPNAERRVEGSFVGLKNLGATCYVNTFLQLWFHNSEVRRAVYQWRNTDEEHSSPDANGDEDAWVPTSICGHLQLIFALLQFGKQRYVDPSSFINHLGLDAAQQQDAQEFSKLFLSLLEETMSKQKNPKVKYVIQEQFCGEYIYVTRCSKCGEASQTPSKFYELDLNIKGNKSLLECINEFLKEEKLEGDNQYMCSHCNTKQNAVRTIQLQKLPPVLNFQLLRFVFEKQSGHKKKLNSYIQFPEVLDMSQCLKEPEETVVYDLTAVLIHRGSSAYRGHYIAHIKDRRSQSWYKFNDEEIERMQGRNLHLGNEDDIEDVGSNNEEKAPKTTKGFHSSRNAYMLVYTRRNEEAAKRKEEIVLEQTLIPPRVHEYVTKANEQFERWIRDLIGMRDQSVESGRVKQKEMKHTYHLLVPKPGDSYEWMDAEWLFRWMADPTKSPSLNNEGFLCPHERLKPEKVLKMKCVNPEGADKLYSKYSGGPRLLGEKMLCLTCVQQRCNIIATKQRMEKDTKFIGALMKFMHNDASCYWVGKTSFRSWRRLALNKLEGKPLTGPGTCLLDDEKLVDYSKSDDWCQGLNFNEDLLCAAHHELTPDATCRRLLPQVVWFRLKTHFATCPEFKRDDPVCELCEMQNQEEQQTKDTNKVKASELKSALSDLYLNKNRPTLNNISTHINVVSSTFVEEWRSFVREPTKRTPVTLVKNSSLICEHGGFLYDPQMNVFSVDQRILTYIWPEEWKILICNYKVDVEIKLKKEDGNLVVSEPDICHDCMVVRLMEEEKERFEFKDEKIYIRKVAKDCRTGPGFTDTIIVAELPDKDDPEFIQGSGKRRKNCPLSSSGEKVQRVNLGSSVRRSHRHRRMRGEKELYVSSSQTLRDLKLKIMKLFSVPPFDQNLILDGTCLTEDSASLGSLKISPGCVILLKADEPPEDPVVLEDMLRAISYPEEGFKGTGLLSN